MSDDKYITLPDFLTSDEIARFRGLYSQHWQDTKTFVDTVERMLDMPRINKKLGQANHPRYLAYAIMAVFIQVDRQTRASRLSRM